MEPHAVPRQITTFEFKLIGFLTLKEFVYLIVFAGLATITFFAAPFELAKYIGAAFVFAIGAFLAFFKYNDRSIDVWIRNLALKLFSSSQYYYRKHDEPPSFLQDITYDRQIATLHVDAKRKLSGYLKTTPNPPVATTQAPPIIEEGDAEPVSAQQAEIMREAMPVDPDSVSVAPPKPQEQPQNSAQQAAQTPNSTFATPVLSGLVKNSKDLPLPNILVYIKDKDGQVARILKTNNNGVFSTTRPFDSNSYVLEPKDSSNRFFFDTIKVDPSSVQQPLIIRSREVL